MICFSSTRRIVRATPLYVAAKNGHIEVVKRLLAKNADVDKARALDGATPLFAAAENGHTEVVKMLLAKNANVDKARTDDGCTPLSMAVKNRHTDVIKLLLNAGANASSVHGNVEALSLTDPSVVVGINSGYQKLHGVKKLRYEVRQRYVE